MLNVRSNLVFLHSKAGWLCCILAMGLLQQGCLAAGWVAAVGTDSMRSSNVTFWPFERSWVSTRRSASATEDPTLKRLAILPVDGDKVMGKRLSRVLEEHTALQVVTTTTPDRAKAALPNDETSQAALAKDLSRKLAVDAVLFGRVAGDARHPSDWGLKEEQSNRLFLYLVDRDGHLLWKDELPFRVVTGSKPPLEEAVQTSLAYHLMDHVQDLRLDDLGYLPRKHTS